ncbi:MAG: hypothetical protein LBJ73_03700 [Rickettsiales bacterium]|jgi:hypothetical protein|nr:hypothetical protein [Rickettsiales bacterium]
MAKLEIKSTTDEVRDYRNMYRLSRDHAAYVLEMHNRRVFRTSDSLFFDMQKFVASHVLQLEKYYKYAGSSGIVAGPVKLDADWKKFLLLWNKQVVFSEKQCMTLSPKMNKAAALIQGVTGPKTDLIKNFTTLSGLFALAAKDNRQVIYGG